MRFTALPFIHTELEEKLRSATLHRRPRQRRECEIWQIQHLAELWQPCIDLLLCLWEGLEHFTYWSNSVYFMSASTPAIKIYGAVCSSYTMHAGFFSLCCLSKVALALPLSGITWHFMTFSSMFFSKNHTYTNGCSHPVSADWVLSDCPPWVKRKKGFCVFVLSVTLDLCQGVPEG